MAARGLWHRTLLYGCLPLTLWCRRYWLSIHVRLNALLLSNHTLWFALVVAQTFFFLRLFFLFLSFSYRIVSHHPIPVSPVCGCYGTLYTPKKIIINFFLNKRCIWLQWCVEVVRSLFYTTWLAVWRITYHIWQSLYIQRYPITSL